MPEVWFWMVQEWGEEDEPLFHLACYPQLLFFAELFCHSPHQRHGGNQVARFVSGYVLEGLSVDFEPAGLSHGVEDGLGTNLGEEESREYHFGWESVPGLHEAAPVASAFIVKGLDVA